MMRRRGLGQEGVRRNLAYLSSPIHTTHRTAAHSGDPVAAHLTIPLLNLTSSRRFTVDSTSEAFAAHGRTRMDRGSDDSDLTEFATPIVRARARAEGGAGCIRQSFVECSKCASSCALGGVGDWELRRLETALPG